MKDISNDNKARVLGFITVVLWAYGLILVRIALRHFSPMALGSLRTLAASVFMIAVVIVKRIKFPKIKDVPFLFLSGVLGFSYYAFSSSYGGSTITAATASVILAIAPVLTAIIASILFKEKINKVSWMAIVLQFFGVVIMVLWNGELSSGEGVLWMLSGSFCVSGYNILQRLLNKKYSPIEITTFSIIFGSLLSLVLSKEGFIQLKDAPLESIIAVLGIGVLTTAFAYTLWSKAIGIVSKTSIISNFMFVTPFLTVFFAMVLLNEKITAGIVVGGLIILGGLMWFNYLNRKEESSDEMVGAMLEKD